MRITRDALRLFLLSLFIFCLTVPGIASVASAWDPASDKGDIVPPLQLFDMQQERIIKTLPNSEAYQTEAKKWLASVTGLAPQITIGHKCGYIIRIPLKDQTQVKLPKVVLEVKDVFLIYCPDKEPLLLIFSAERKPFLLQFTADVKPFMQQLLTPQSSGNVKESNG
ncbi:type IV secretion system protein VirB6 [Paenibacillus apiarius]|uniref:type IV secretion system protein VirB6 n=1 Tax=Paenibacillus apiarius TaxID=46240 RepID=UPI00197D6A17|nr:type IV secretion system protein VirB6 [Paenibacillus apiarius]MBN3527558.1 type IV secretion system protein VirB6 [Paenibacillus apiarius]